MLYEYLPLDYRGAFKSSDQELNKIWDVSAYTMHLTSREFFIDGIKRDRWVWSGDAYQSYLMNYYLFFDSASVERTLLALRGKRTCDSSRKHHNGLFALLVCGCLRLLFTHGRYEIYQNFLSTNEIPYGILFGKKKQKWIPGTFRRRLGFYRLGERITKKPARLVLSKCF